MKLTELSPAWLVEDGKRVGFCFRSPTDPKWWQSCFAASPARRDQWKLIKAANGNDENIQACSPGTQWTIAGGIENASFDTLTVTPSLDGSRGGLWHGFIRNGEMV